MPSQRIILGTGLAILLLIGAASIGLDLKSRSDTASVDHALEVLKKISDMRPLMRSAESAARGFALTGDQRIRHGISRDTSAAFLPAFDDLIEAVKDNPGETRLLEETKALVEPPDCLQRRIDQAAERRRPRRHCGAGRRPKIARRRTTIGGNLEKAVAEERRLLAAQTRRIRDSTAASCWRSTSPAWC